MNPGPPLLSLHGVSRRYGDHHQWAAVRDVNLTISPGEFVAVIGRSGSGKSTLLNVIALLDSDWEGTYDIGGVNAKQLSGPDLDFLRAKTFGFVFQSSYANPYETTARNVALGLAIQGIPLREQGESVSRALDLVGLTGRSSSLARSLSGGERQRLAIARAIATNPSVIVADEPTGNLDSETGNQVMEVLSELNRSGTSLVVVTHDPEIAKYADRVMRMNDGVLSETRTSPRRKTRDSTTLRSVTSVNAQAGRSARLRRAVERVFRAINNVTSRPLRSVALIAAFALAFAGLVGAAGIGSTASQQIADRLTAAARDEVRVNVPSGTTTDQRIAWMTRIRALDHVESVGEIATLDAGTARTARFALLPSLNDSPFPGSTLAADPDLFNVLRVQTTPSDAARLFAASGGQRVAVVGHSVVESLGLAQDGLGAEVWVNGEPYSIVGTITASPRQPNLLTSVVVPMHLFSSTSSQLVVRTSAGYSGPLAKAIPLALSPTAPGSISVETASELHNLRIGVQTDLNGLLGSLAAALLALAVLSGASAMYLSVQSRTQELALSRALGLGQAGVAAVFLWEGVVIGLAGALAGISGGLAISVSVAAAHGWTALAPWATIALSPLAGAICGAVAAFLPAMRAAKIDPSEAIR
ncbi:macrolide transport system ATP-binding/permease protein [Cryobacterium mesophilum]|jgi:macrolide transport system ATP-binding/permease protein|uniref:ATP-binding cassette domain-containing protein n=1 Tax=Terrimesophilobacter mesophilus TaxID=433647 RepID=A0A4R8VBA5_9MICO|nr:ATP-binding cassette domain-containing protein [Terrimesophilobacter mesophilus]MBB5633139.1 macrolide transport system ATP-binding/permease protein [Terrimesophilobacter mesophilus]TFB79895.1 ATP-binding cassette domain-containing protein [Terrimesophilobacter mesophilus]